MNRLPRLAAERRRHRNALLGLAALVAAGIALVLVGERCGAAEVRNQIALAKCRIIVQTCYPDSGFYPWCGTLVREHERVADLKGAPEFASSWWYSLVYGGANFGVRVGGIAPGSCAGPMDVKHWPLVLEPGANIRWHVREAYLGYSKGYRGLRNAEYVMLPSAPRDWGGGRFRKTDARHRAVIRRAYKEGRLEDRLGAGLGDR